MDKQKLHKNHPQALGSGPWLFYALKKFWLCHVFRHEKNEIAKSYSFTMAAKTSTTLRVFPPVSFSLKYFFTLWFFLEGSDEEVEKAEIKEKTMKSCGSSETPLAFVPNPFTIL